jgi:anti-sigma factor RsiW
VREHPSDGQIEKYARHTLAPVDLLAVDDHLAECAACRSRAEALARQARPHADLGSELLPAESHLSEEQVGEYVSGGLDARARQSVDAHLAACATCARDVAALRDWAGKRTRRLWPVAAAAAAAVLLAVLIPLGMHRQPVDSAPGRRVAGVAGLETLSPHDRQRVEAAVRAGAAEPPADLGGLPEALMGRSPDAAPSESFRLIGPQATAVLSQRPTLRWDPLAGADSYTVVVTTDALQRVTQSPSVTEPSWTPDQPLPRGRTYLWQVTARSGAKSVTAPAPPAPIAKFRVVDAETVRLLEQTAAAQPDAHLVLGILYTQAGALAEARDQLSKVPRTDPGYDVARRTLARLGEPAAPQR